MGSYSHSQCKGVRRPGGEADHSHQPIAQVKNPLPQYVFTPWC
jgi:hypothetical protein